MHPNFKLLLAAANDPGFKPKHSASRRSPFTVEIDRRGLFVSVGRFDAYLCAEPSPSWSYTREPGCLDAQFWRLHLILGRAPGACFSPH